MGKILVESTTESTNNGVIPQKDVKVHGSQEVNIDSYYGPELPRDVLFPDQLNKYLREQIQSLSLENGSLRRSLEEMQDELNNSKKKLSKPANLPINGRASEIAANKIAELSKKLREQNAELEGMKTRAKDAEAKLRQLEITSVEQPSAAPPPSEDELFEKDKQIKVLTEKLQSTTAKMCDFRNQCLALKQELKLAQKVIESEVGEKVVFQDLVKENGSWRGRAQQIISLQNKIQHLQEQLSNSSSTEIPAANVLRQMEKDRRASYEETTKQLNQKTIQLEELRKKWEASKARNKVLENEIIQVKTKLSSLIDKGARDEQLMASLNNQINVYEDRGKAQVQCFSKMQDSLIKQQKEIDLEKQKNEQLKKALFDRDNRIQRYQDQVDELKKIKNISVEDSISYSINKFEESGTSIPVIPDKSALTILDSERMRLLELLAIVNRRLDESRKLHMDAETQLKKEKFKNAKLETKVARLELEKVGALKTGRGSYGQGSHKATAEPNIEEMDLMARQQIEYLEEECLALRTRIETLQMEKEDDLKVFAAMTDMRDVYNRKVLCNSTAKLNSPTEKKSNSKLINKKVIDSTPLMMPPAQEVAKRLGKTNLLTRLYSQNFDTNNFNSNNFI